jgi:hypothetical protein
MPCSCNHGWRCEEHPDRGWPHDDCPGPGIPCEAAHCPYRADPLKDLLETDFDHSGGKGEPDESTLKMAEHVRKLGHSALAERLISAHMESLRAEDVCAQFMALQSERELTGTEQEQSRAAQEGSDKAFEDFRKVMAEVLALCGIPIPEEW